MMINMDLFEKAGATAPDRKLEEFNAAAEKLAALPDTFAFGLQGKENRDDALLLLRAVDHGGDISQGRTAPAASTRLRLSKRPTSTRR